MRSSPPDRKKPVKAKPSRKHISRVMSVIPAMLLFAGLLVILYLVFPKTAGKKNVPSVYDGLVISEVMASNSFAVPDENGAFPDWVELYNGTGSDLNLEGVMIANQNDRVAFTFPSYELKEGKWLVVFASGRYQTDPDKPFHGRFKISAAGCRLCLYSPDRYLIDEVNTPSLASNTSYILIREPEESHLEYDITEYYSPGYENTLEGHMAYRSERSIQGGSILINEICPAPRRGMADEDGDFSDWVELRNTTNEPVSLGGFYLSDKEKRPLKWRFPEAAVIPAGGYYLVFCSGKDRIQEDGVPHTNFRISAERETLVLSDGYGRVLDRVSIENVPRNYSVGRGILGTLEFFAIPTPGYSNDGR